MKKFLFIIMTFSLNCYASPWESVRNMAPAGSELSDFGISSVFTEDYLVVSWPKTYDQTGRSEACGEVITYQKNGTEFEEVSRLTAADLVGSCVPGDGFGYGLSYNQGRLAIGMPAGARTGINLEGGATDADSRVFITTFDEGNWQLEQSLTADDLGGGQGMGFYVELEGDYLLVHAHKYDSIFGFAFVESYGVYVFKHDGQGFVQQQKLTESFRFFGQDFDLKNGQIVVGAWGEQRIGAAGRIYVYEEQNNQWDVVQTINDPNNRNLGNQVQIEGDIMVAGSVNVGRVGAIVVFERTADGWQQKQLIEASDAAVNDQFGIFLDFDEDEIVVGASAGTNQVQTIGAVYHFTLQDDGTFIEQQKIESPLQNEAADQFGASLAFNQTDLVVSESSGRGLAGSVTNFWHYSRDGAVNPTANINQTTSGVWQASGVEGQSANIEILNNNKALMYLNYANDEGSTWLFSVGDISTDSINFNQVFRSSGAQFGEQFDPQDLILSDVGSASFVLNSCESGSLNLQVDENPNQQFELVKNFAISSLECNSVNKALANGVSGSWYDPTRSGEGFSIYTHGIGSEQTASVHWYTYDGTGNPRVFVGQGAVQGSLIDINELKQYGPGAVFGESAESTIVGNMSLLWEGCSDLMVEYDLSSNGLGMGTYNLVQLSRVKDSNCP